MYSVPPVCPKCKGSRKLIKLVEDEELRKQLPPGWDYEHPRPICDKCNGMGTLHVEAPGEYPPPPRPQPALTLSPDQQKAIDAIKDWLGTKDKRLSLGGYAGTGKTTIISELLKTVRGRVVKVCAPTGKAAAVLRNKKVDASTLHRLIYQPQTYCTIHGVQTGEKDGDIKLCEKCRRPLSMRWVRVPIIDADFVIVDESSMLNLSMVNDVESLAKKILYVGDHGQLEPIGEDPGIMSSPDIRLEQIHRQAAQSGIIQLAHHMRRGSGPLKWQQGEMVDARVTRIKKLVPQILKQFDVVLCGYNKTRKDVNSQVRRFRGFKGALPEPGERIICLQNDSDLGIYNGLMVTVQSRRQSDMYPKYDLIDEVGNQYYDIPVHPDQFAEEKKIDMWTKGIGLFDFGYALTTHKSQGSEWDNVAVIEQIARAWNPARWRYTAATRAAKRLEYWIPTGRM